jgi:hypothetical protein
MSRQSPGTVGCVCPRPSDRVTLANYEERKTWVVGYIDRAAWSLTLIGFARRVARTITTTGGRTGGSDMKLFPGPILACPAPCASNPGVVPIGPDTFMVSRQAATGFYKVQVTPPQGRVGNS